MSLGFEFILQGFAVPMGDCAGLLGMVYSGWEPKVTVVLPPCWRPLTHA